MRVNLKKVFLLAGVILGIVTLVTLFGLGGCDVQDGPYREYYPNGQLKNEEFYRDGQLDGPSRWYYKSGRLKGETFYKDGTLHGVFKDYHENGQVRFEEVYKNGLPEHVAKFYDENGKLEKNGPPGEWRGHKF
ncbi:MAG: toxin-antitoxin system YwqK family antitoxin [Candidatus Omnitrophota bacterium]